MSSFSVPMCQHCAKRWAAVNLGELRLCGVCAETERASRDALERAYLAAEHVSQRVEAKRPVGWGGALGGPARRRRWTWNDLAAGRERQKAWQAQQAGKPKETVAALPCVSGWAPRPATVLREVTIDGREYAVVWDGSRHATDAEVAAASTRVLQEHAGLFARLADDPQNP